MRKIAAVLALGAVVLSAASCGKDQQLKMPELKVPEALKPDTPEEKVQKQVAAVLKAEDDARFYREVGDLLFLSRDLKWDSRRLVSEVVACGEALPADAARQRRYVMLLRSLDVPRTAVVDVAATRLESGKGDAEVNRALLLSAAPPDPLGSADFSHFRPYLEARQGRPPEHLVLWMYNRDPGAALREMIAAYGQGMPPDQRRAALVAERIVDQVAWKERNRITGEDSTATMAAEQLEALSKSNEWCVRLYVASVMKKHAAVRKDDVMRALAGDSSAIVRKAAGA